MRGVTYNVACEECDIQELKNVFCENFRCFNLLLNEPDRAHPAPFGR